MNGEPDEPSLPDGRNPGRPDTYSRLRSAGGRRTAIGGGRGRIIRQLLTESVLLSLVGAIAGMRPAMIAVAVGTAAALAFTRLLPTFLFGVKDKDPAVVAMVALLLSLVSLLAVWLPARRGTGIDAVIALRYE
jgi:putative ABC transport system permease protein